MRFISVVKPGIIFGNIVTVCAGFFLASHTTINLPLLIITIIGMIFVIAAGCVVNNIIDQDIDRLMERTKNRVLAKGLLSNKVAILYAVILGIIGILILYYYVNHLAALAALIGLFFYIVIYTLWLKRKSIYGTIVGGVAGAMPPVVGYCAVTHRFDTGATLLFLILFFWQIPHFYAIAIYRIKDYTAANIPILPVKIGVFYTKLYMLCYLVIFTVMAILPAIFGYVGIIYFMVALIIGLAWIGLGIQGLKGSKELKELKELTSKNDTLWARRMFLFSIIAITALSFTMMVK